MEKPAQVHIVTYDGPEWSTIKGVFYDKDAADAFAKLKNETKNKEDVYDSLSDYVVRSYGVTGCVNSSLGTPDEVATALDGLPFSPDLAGVAALVREYKAIYNEAVRAATASVDLELTTPIQGEWAGFTAWLRQTAFAHEQQIWAHHEPVAAHIKWLRDWAQRIDSIKPTNQ